MATKKQSTEGAIKVRVLADSVYGKPNDVVEVAAGTDLTGLAGVLDATPEAVAYAESLAVASDE